MKKIVVTVILSTVFITGCASKEANPEQQSREFNILLIEAERSVKKAAAVGGLWRDTEKYIAQAKKAHQQGNYKKALKQVRAAKKQAELGYQQALEQQNAKPWLF